MENKEIIDKIVSKKEFSDLPKKDVEMAFEKFDLPEYTDEEKIDYTRDLLRKVFSAFTSTKILSIKDKDKEWVLRKHLSTKERLGHYERVYSRILGGYGKVSVVDFGAGVNGFSYDFFPSNVSVNYLAIESMGQLVNLMNYYFDKSEIPAKALKESLFNLDSIKGQIKHLEGPRVCFLFKTMDSMEMLSRNYSKYFLSEIAPNFDKIVVSFATRSLVSKRKFKVDRSWIINYISENFTILDDFEEENERYLVFKKG